MHNFAIITKNGLDTELFWINSTGSIEHQSKRANGPDRRALVADVGAVDSNGNIAVVTRGNKINVFWINRGGSLCSNYLVDINKAWGGAHDVNPIRVAIKHLISNVNKIFHA